MVSTGMLPVEQREQTTRLSLPPTEDRWRELSRRLGLLLSSAAQLAVQLAAAVPVGEVAVQGQQGSGLPSVQNQPAIFLLRAWHAGWLPFSHQSGNLLVPKLSRPRQRPRERHFSQGGCLLFVSS
ncbi:unnamed protein product [Lampetra planeri]